MKRRAFTLIELLVVIAILTVLLALMLSVLNRSKHAAYKLTCLNNLKQLGLAITTYAQIYGYYPICVPPDVNERWQNFLADKSIANGRELGVPVSLWPFHQSADLYNCPILNGMNCDISYCYNSLAGAKLAVAVEVAFVEPSYNPPPKKYEMKTRYRFLKPQEVKSPANFILLYDQPLKMTSTSSTDDYDPYKDIDPDSEDSRFFLWRYDDANAFGPHMDGHNILFGDSHVKWYKGWSDSEMTGLPK